MKKMTLLLLLSFPLFSFAQNIEWGDSAYNVIMETECDKLFTKVEHIASLSVTAAAYTDSLKSYRGVADAIKSSGQTTYSFTITKSSSQLIELDIIAGNRGPAAMAIYQAILHFPKCWLPAIQNYRKVCSRVKCEVSWNGGVITTRIFQ